EGLHRLLASVSGGDPKPIQRLIEDRAADEFARGAGLMALGTMMQHGLLERTWLSNYLMELYRQRLEKEGSHVWDSLVQVSTDLGFQEHLEWIREAYKEGLADP